MIYKKPFKRMVLEHEKEGWVSYSMPEGLIGAIELEELVKKPADEILKTLNRGQSVALSFMQEDQRWINDYAMGQVIIRLKTTVDKLRSENRYLRSVIDDKGKA